MISAALRKTPVLFGTIKFSHSIFALPYALLTLFVASGGRPAPRVLGWTVAAMVGARTAAMAFNRLVDRRLDAQNPRTASRALPSRAISAASVAALAAAGVALFVFAAASLNRAAGLLSVPVLVVLLGYSYTKRFTDLSHFVLGLALGLAPLGAWVAARGDAFLESPGFPLLMGGAVLLWTAGFDVIYSCQDFDFDRGKGLRSLPARLGVGRALMLARWLHVGTVLLLVLAGVVASLSWLYLIGVAVVAILLAYEHSLVRESDLSRVNAAFFTVNGWVSVTLFLFTLLDLWVRGSA